MLREYSPTKAQVEDIVHQNPIPLPTMRGWTIVKLFISSTFLDMHGERDCIARVVVPEINAWLHTRRARLVAVDLRYSLHVHRLLFSRILGGG